MLMTNFLMRKGVRSAQYLANPNIISTKLFSLPQKSVIHYLDMSIDSKFPNRNHYYFKDVDENKKIRIINLTDLDNKVGTTSLKNRYLEADIRKWKINHRKSFKEENFFEDPVTDNHNTSVINYNTILDLYNYGSSNIVDYYRITNVIRTFIANLKKSLKTNKDKVNIVSLTLPREIPGFVTMNKFRSYNPRKLMNIVNDDNLLWLHEWWLWLSNETRGDSILKELTDEESKNILIELKFRGYACYVPLSVFRGMSVDSKLESTRKLEDKKNRKFFLVFMMKLQERMAELSLAGYIANEVTKDDSDPADYKTDEEYEDEVIKAKAESVDDNEVLEKVEQLKKDVSIKDNETVKTSVKAKENKIIIDDENIFDTDFDFDEDILATLDDFDTVGLSTTSKRPTLVKSLIDDNIDEEDGDDDEEEVVEEALKEMDELIEPEELPEEVIEELLKEDNVEDIIEEYIQAGRESGTVTASDVTSLRNAQSKRSRLKDPYRDQPLNDTTPIKKEPIQLDDKEVTKIKTSNKLIAEDLLTDKIASFDKQYVKHYLKDDMVGVVKDLEAAGVIITNYEIEDVRTSVDNYEIHKLDMRIIGGGAGPVYFKIPKIDEDGSFMVSGRKYRLRKTKQDLPIRKISEVRVALTSNYGKFFVGRTLRKAYDGDGYVLDYIRKEYLEDNGNIVKIIPGKKRLNLKRGLPNLYYVLASDLDKVITRIHTYIFNEEEIASVVKEKDLDKIKANGRVFIGYVNGDQNLISIDTNNVLHNETTGDVIGKLTDILNIDSSKIPKQYSYMMVMGKEIPLGVVLGYYFGLNSLISITKTKFRVMSSNKRVTLSGNETQLRFRDYRLILDLNTIEKKLLFHGFLYYKDFIKDQNLRFFDNKDIYLDLIEFRGCGLYHLKELDLLKSLFVDSITKDVLIQMKEPTTYLRLLFRANQMLADYGFPDINDPTHSRIRGYDRVPGLAYKALTESIRDNKLNGRRNKRISVDPYKVWNYITQDNSKQPREALNPISSIKEDEVVTLTGSDGLSTKAVPVEMRRYHQKDAGLFSEATSDSKNVAISASLTPYAKLKNVRGVVEDTFEEIEENPGKIFSTPVLISPFSEYDDPKRINATNIQATHTVSSAGYTQSPIRTGYEYVIPYKTGSDFCLMAEDDGEVLEKDDYTITLKYKNGEVKAYQIGDVYTNYEGVTYKNNLISNLVKGKKFKAGDNIYYHETFFEPDWLDPTKIVVKMNKTYTMALASNTETYEDSSSVSEKVKRELTTSVLRERVFVLDFSTNIDLQVKPGQEVVPNTTLFIDTGESEEFGNLPDASMSLLDTIASESPRSNFSGVVDRIEIKYNGEIEDMSPSLAKLARALDKDIFLRTKGTTYEAKDNKVTGDYSSEGNKLNVNTAEIKIYINTILEMEGGDKQAFGNQAKSVIARVYSNKIIGEESGDEVDAQYATVSVVYRIINSPMVMGTTNRLTRLYSKEIAKAYFGKK